MTPGHVPISWSHFLLVTIETIQASHSRLTTIQKPLTAGRVLKGEASRREGGNAGNCGPIDSWCRGSLPTLSQAEDKKGVKRRDQRLAGDNMLRLRHLSKRE